MSKVILADIIEIISGGTPKTSKSEYWNGDIGWLSINDFNKDFKRVFTSEKTITEQGLKESNTKILEIDDLIISARGTVGVLAQIGTPMAFNQSCFGLRARKNIIDNNYLYYVLKNYVSNIQKKGQGSVFNTINLDSFKLMEINIEDSLIIQKKIANILSSLDDKIELNNKLNDNLEQMAKTLYDYWFVQFDFPDKNGKPYKSSGGKMVWNEQLKREIPNGWKLGVFGDYSKSKGGFAFKSEWWMKSGIPVIKIKDIQENYTLNLASISFVDENKVEIAKSFQAKAGDVVIAMTGATVGKYAIVPISDRPILVNQRVALFELGHHPILKLPFLINSLNQKYFREAVFMLASGAAQPNISSTQIDNISLVIPEISIVEKFNLMMHSVYQKILIDQAENKSLSQLRDWLLPMLMNGQVTID